MRWGSHYQLWDPESHRKGWCWVGTRLPWGSSSQLRLVLEAQVGPGTQHQKGWAWESRELEPHSFLHQVEMKFKSPSIPSATAHFTDMCLFESSPRKERSGGDYANIPSSPDEPNFNKYACSSLMCLTNQRRSLLYKSPSDSQASEFI